MRLERTREVLHVLVWAGVPPMKAATLPWRQGLPLWLAQVVLAAWSLWALRRRLLPEAWCVQLRCLPIRTRAALAADIAVSAAVLAPLAGLYALSAIFFAIKRPAWWWQSWAGCVSSLAASWLASCLLGAAALAWQRRGTVARAVRAMRVQAPEALLAERRPRFAALLWSPWWRGALTPGGVSISVGMASALVIAALWTTAPWPVTWTGCRTGS